MIQPIGNGDDPEYNTDDTPLSFDHAPQDSSESIFFFTEDDQLAQKNIFGSISTEVKRNKKMHKQKFKEQLMIGSEGVIDAFKLASKGMLLREDKGTKYYDV